MGTDLWHLLQLYSVVPLENQAADIPLSHITLILIQTSPLPTLLTQSVRLGKCSTSINSIYYWFDSLSERSETHLNTTSDLIEKSIL